MRYLVPHYFFIEARILEKNYFVHYSNDKSVSECELHLFCSKAALTVSEFWSRIQIAAEIVSKNVQNSRSYYKTGNSAIV